MYFVKEFVSFMMHRKKYWLLPIFLTVVFMGVLLVALEGSAVAPFIYSLF